MRSLWSCYAYACFLIGAIGSSAIAASDVLDRSLAIDIPAQTISTALIVLSKQADVQILMPGISFADRQTPGLRGQMTLRTALTALLGEGRYQSRQVGDNTIAIEQTGEHAK